MSPNETDPSHEKQIEELQETAWFSDDAATLQLCARALQGDPVARAQVAVILAGRGRA